MPIWRGTTSNDWGTASNWIIDGSGNTGVPTSTTDAIFDASSTVLCTTGNVGIRNCRDIITTGHTGTLEIGSGTNGDIRVWRNATIGTTTITGSSYLSMYSGSTSTLNVTIGTTIPNLKIEPTVTSSTITLTNTTVVTNYFKTEFASGANVTFSAASAVELRVNNIVSHIRTTTMGTNTTMRFMGGTFVTCTITGTYILNTGATLTGTGTSGATLSFSNFSGGSATSSLDLSAGTLVLTPISNTYTLGTGIQIGNNTLTLNMGTNQIDHFSINNSGPNQAFLVMQSNLVANKSFYTQFYGVRVTTNGFNIITKETVGALSTGFVANSGKIVFQGVPTASGFLGMGFVSGSTLTLTSVTSGSLAAWQTIHFPTVAGANSNVITGCTTFNSSYSLQNAQTVGSVGSPVPIYGYGAMNVQIGNVTGGTHCLFEVDAGSNDTYLFTLGLNTLTTEFRYLSTNTGAFDGSKATAFPTAGNSNGVIDFQGQSSPTKFINTISYPQFFQLLTLKSNLYVNDFLGGTGQDCGLSQTGGSFTLFVMRNFQAGNSATRPIQPTVELIGSTPANFTCGLLCGNIVINKSGGAVVTVTQNFIYGYSTATTFTYTAGQVNFGSTTMITNGNFTVVNPVSVGNFSFNNVTINGNHTITITNPWRILGTLLLNGTGTTTFLGTHGWTANVVTCSNAGSIINLQNVNANPNSEYIVTSSLTLIGTSASRITLQAAGSASYNGTITPVGQLNVTSGTTPTAGMTISQATGQSPVGLIGLLPNRPVITGGGPTAFTISPSATQTITSPFAMRAGFKAKFTLQSAASQNVAYVTTQDIDSNAGATILSFGSNGDDVSTNVSLFRTLNWGPLIAPSGSVYYTWVD